MWIGSGIAGVSELRSVWTPDLHMRIWPSRYILRDEALRREQHSRKLKQLQGCVWITSQRPAPRVSGVPLASSVNPTSNHENINRPLASRSTSLVVFLPSSPA